ncbi:hypothetical protein Q5P01_007918 [Channa striata]|uniref:Opioid growth factor receptor (OGFr) conserved domain-containing protein n=1 Tax=Channa striata TaxID=64152 RepID=A0AA88NA44_CHASR|nr:hypothetical protein Q5P01_007918 [Channa striata]
MEDDCVCDYDSTWDTESDGDDPAGENQTRRSSQDKNKSGWTLWHHTPRNMRAAKDMQNYRRGYPNLADDECSEDKMNNLLFYLNKFPSAPDDIYIDSFLKEWKNDYKRLERVHSYIQWLFPLREPGVNYMASELTKKEIEAFKKNDEAKRRLVEAYELMLGFYGIRLVNKETGEVKRAENWKERFGNLERNMHNNLRITRILKSLGELGFGHYQTPLVRFFLEETLVKKTLSSVKRSVLDYFLFAVLDKQKRQELVRFAYHHFEPKDKFVWCPRRIQKQFKKRPDSVGNGDGKDEVCSQVKGKDGEAVMQQKQDVLDDITKGQKETDKTASKEKNKLSEVPSEVPPETTPEADIVRNGNAKAECDDDIVGNGNDSADDVDEMDHSPSSDTAMAKPEPSTDSQDRLNSSEDIIQEQDNNIQAREDIDPKKPQKKKKDNIVLPSNDSGEDSPSGEMEENGQTCPSVQTPHKTSVHSPSPLIRGEKMARTEFNQTANEEQEEAHHRKVCQQQIGLCRAPTNVCMRRQMGRNQRIALWKRTPEAQTKLGNT